MTQPVNSKELTQRIYWKIYGSYFPIVPNVYIYNWESDILAVNINSKYITEYEIKISKSDFKADFKKKNKHQLLTSKNKKESCPNYFYYVSPPGLIDKKDIPDYAGLIEIGKEVKYIKRAKLLHNKKSDVNYQLLMKAYYKFWTFYTKMN